MQDALQLEALSPSLSQETASRRAISSGTPSRERRLMDCAACALGFRVGLGFYRANKRTWKLLSGLRVV